MCSTPFHFSSAVGRSGLLALFLGLLGAVPASSAETWRDTFDADSLSGRVPGGEKGVLVVAGGPSGQDRDDAVNALVEALRASGTTEVVIDGAALGDVSTLDDATIVGKSSALPVARVVIARVYPGGDAPVVVVTVYDKSGRAFPGFTATRGKPLPPAPIGTASPEAPGPRSGSKEAPPEAISTAADAEYRRRFVGFHDARFDGNGRLDDFDYAYQGDARVEIDDDDDFYAAVGRQDYADYYRSRNRLKKGLMWGGIGGMAAGTVTMAIFALQNSAVQSLSGNTSSDLDAGFFAGVGVLAAGGVIMISSFFIDRDPVDESEWHRLAAEHNVRLRQELGLPPVDGDPVPTSSLGPQFDFGITGLAGGAYMGLNGRF